MLVTYHVEPLKGTTESRAEQEDGARWVPLRHECEEMRAEWPLAAPPKTVADEFRQVCQGVPGKEWTKVKCLNEQGKTVDEFLLGFNPPL